VNLVELASLRIRVGESKEFVRLCRSSSSWLPVFVVAHLALPMFVIVFGGRVESCDGRDPVVRWSRSCRAVVAFLSRVGRIPSLRWLCFCLGVVVFIIVLICSGGDLVLGKRD